MNACPAPAQIHLHSIIGRCPGRGKKAMVQFGYTFVRSPETMLAGMHKGMQRFARVTRR